MIFLPSSSFLIEDFHDNTKTFWAYFGWAAIFLWFKYVTMSPHSMTWSDAECEVSKQNKNRDDKRQTERRKKINGSKETTGRRNPIRVKAEEEDACGWCIINDLWLMPWPFSHPLSVSVSLFYSHITFLLPRHPHTPKRFLFSQSSFHPFFF